MSAQISAFLQQNVGMLVVNGNVKNEEMGKEETRLLDYACGTGLITKVCCWFYVPIPFFYSTIK